MKRLLSLFVVLALLVTACTKPEPDNPQPNPETPKQESVTLASGTNAAPVIATEGGSASVSFTASTSWSASIINTKADSWCSVVPTSGVAGAASITITAKENTTPDNRSASVVIKAGTATQTIKVEQKQKDALTVTASSFEISADGGEIKVATKSNVPFIHTISTDAQSWIKAVQTKALKDSTLTFEIDVNKEKEGRTGEIYLSSGALKDTVKVYQQGDIPRIIITKKQYTLKSEGESFEVEVASNVNATMNMVFPQGADAWITENTTKAVSTNKFYFTAQANETTDSRTALLIFANAENNLADTVSVIQAQKDAIALANSKYAFDHKGGNLDFEIQANVDVQVTIPDTCSNWIKQVQTRGLETKKLYFDISPLDASREYRTGYITIKGGAAEQTIQVLQSKVNEQSKDGQIKILQTATKGSGIDLVLMGDAFTSKLVTSGVYDYAMNIAKEKFFSEEPYKSFKDHFNVYSIAAVSDNDKYVENGSTVFGGYFGEGTLVGGNDQKVMDYATKVIGDSRMDNAIIVVIMNSTVYAGTCYMYYSSADTCDFGNGLSISYFPIGEDDKSLEQLIHHEAAGHGFAKLADEYSYIQYGKIPESDIESYKNMLPYGWYKNVDITDDPEKVKWAKFLTDTRYKNDSLGVFEGGMTYWTGVWRPTKYSIMNENTGGFNAPSREAIYYRIHKLAYGADWEYDYEKFVEWDAINRKSEARTKSMPLVLDPEKNKLPHTPPVVVPHSWREAK